MLQSAYGLAAIQSRNPGSRYAFPTRQRATITEYSAVLKEKAATIDLDLSQWEREAQTSEKYAESFALEVQSKSIAGKRIVASEFHRDGTGVLGEVSSAASYNTTTDTQVITIKSGASDPGSVGHFQQGDWLILTQNDGTARDPAGTTTNFHAWEVADTDRENNTVTIKPVTSAGALDTDITGSQAAATDVFYRYGDPALSAEGGTSVTSSIDLGSVTDYGADGFDIAGIDAFAQNDGRVVNGVTLSGAEAATIKTLSNNETLDVRHIQQLLSKVKIAVGADAYSWKLMTLSPEAADTLIDSRENDRRFQTVQDNTRGTSSFNYVHRKDNLEIYESEFCKPASLYLMPEAKDGKKVIEYWGSDWTPVRGKGMSEFHLSVNSSGNYENAQVSFMKVKHQAICLHNAAIGRLDGFTTI